MAEDDDAKAKTSQREQDEKKFLLKIYSAYENYYEGLASSLSAENDTGPFDILPQHHNFMTLVNEGEVIIRVEGEDDRRLHIARGVLHVRKNKVTLFLDV